MEVAKIFKPSIDAILQTLKGITGDLDPEDTVIIGAAFTHLFLAYDFATVYFSGGRFRWKSLALPRSGP